MKSDQTFRVVIVGGGPCGLFSAWNLARKTGTACEITVLESTARPGGKILTRNFAGVGLYEAGVAEIYDYSAIGPDPLRELIETDLQLEIKHISGGACFLDGKLLRSADDLADHFGPAARNMAKGFRARCANMLSPGAFYNSVSTIDNQHPWAKITGETLLATEISDEGARRYIRVMAHSDVAAPPHQTTGLTFLKNVLMDVEGYIDIFSVVGGNEGIVNRLMEQLDAKVLLNSPVRSVEPRADGTYRIEAGPRGGEEVHIADFVILAIPLTALSLVDWRSESLRSAIGRHTSHFDRPAHYVRATLLFERPFWRELVDGAWWMVDAFDGCAVYDEGARHSLGSYGALGFLISGNSALWVANLSDEQVEELCLDALPPALAHGRKLLVDRRIHRWMASVSAQPGGFPSRTPIENHRPDPDRLPGVFMVGDYIFDATLNGAFDSADNATDMILAEILLRRAGTVKAHYRNEENPGIHLNGAAALSIELARAGRDRMFDGCLVHMLRTIWSLERADVLVAGPSSSFGRESGGTHFDGDLRALPFPDDHFDVIVETGLCYLSRNQIRNAAAELRRVARRGIVLGSVTCDLAIDLLERHDLLASIEILASRWDWSQELLSAGFDLALLDPIRLAQAWDAAQALGAGPGSWYDEPESLLYSFFDSGKINTRAASPSEATCLASDGQTTPGQIVPPYGDRLRVVSR